MTEKYLICSDIDGTLLRQDQTVSEKTRDLIQTLEKDGHIFSISTGRMYPSAREVGFKVSNSGHVIASNGSYAAIRDEQLLKTTLETHAIRSTYEIMSDFDLPLFFFSTNALFYTKEPPAFFRELADKSRLDTGHKSFSLVSIDDKSVFDENMHQFLNAIVIAENEASKLTEVRTALNEANGIRVLSSHHDNLEILPANSDKKTAVEALGKHYGIPRERIITFGDGENDIGMLQYAGTGVAMANASDNVKAAASHLTDTNEADGVYKFLKEFIS
ncbi:HAD family hydrolase [Listeria cossartiae subsp. cayugensis]|uniref:HAD family hydrolase n=1 Tax=Listeria cossartiae TaxID=2838249 RepID=UPI00287FF8D4|nr:HAD family hydrolase [Listeria cossartiae]MDT0001757.1 HAD family hydrolase [Listeria cossartiae subsp. cayugensis]MDT0009956.1 HAD family hydrolase [Listeria cossartiae subsp. cayugensis]MDT0031787.1 HAD family hydrolase [Listeria cossartiae subsp. cayugensis]MDT0039884.1 HAD family hydrolase [Listeria cossartiae subsp. cayugensis]MDT0045254.1 HAD family hydrolase [Listeria cossartiae subsp. cayugensis]